MPFVLDMLFDAHFSKIGNKDDSSNLNWHRTHPSDSPTIKQWNTSHRLPFNPLSLQSDGEGQEMHSARDETAL